MTLQHRLFETGNCAPLGTRYHFKLFNLAVVRNLVNFIDQANYVGNLPYRLPAKDLHWAKEDTK